ncbi:hypothetical protein [Streptacidiphilus sp. P02-A3a]|uniref:hypothetical protein n=1 Tax=Streptacidiphilus sp. P02-A3a TaxID=2704468 RepID=UPI0015F8DD73|nr:hypothetical protein [Streptacidiphilus sp. P02-A3a]QMU68349.1 hypothetical protein GXP74_09025 [Streptacidiphilus sp. P02-A3a]
MVGSGHTFIELTALPSKPRGKAINPAWRYLVGAHATVQGVFDGLTVVRASKAKEDARGRLGRDEADLLRAAIVFTSSGIDACCKRLLRDSVPLLINGNTSAARKFDDYVKQELAEGPSAAMSAAIRSLKPREEMVRLYVAARTKASFQGSDDLKSRLRDTLGISNTQLPTAKLKTLDDFFVARNAIVHDLDYVNPSGTGSDRHVRSLDGVQTQCDSALVLVAEFIAEAAVNIRALPKS